MENNQNKSQWDDALEEQIIGLNECQKSYNLDSCTPCEKFFDCEIRKKYVIAVYESMNKGSTGGFEF
ncbi:MAG: hypothetical protein ACNI28_00060 [Arcobacter sp.]|uniref:hypothetical protein n=1 Tax=Arcobacter sp. TaxID=1872629 RepID=UPI003B005F90